VNQRRFITGARSLNEPSLTIKLDRLIVLSKSSLLGWFLHVSLIVIIKGRSPMEVSLERAGPARQPTLLQGPGSSEIFTGVLGQYTALAHLDHRANRITAAGAERLPGVPARCTALDLSFHFISVQRRDPTFQFISFHELSY
jgi:hypothetical protein